VTGEHGVAFKLAFDLGVGRTDAVSIPEVNQVVKAILPADVVQLQVLMNKPSAMQFFKGT
jgi:hypothetical protein